MLPVVETEVPVVVVVVAVVVVGLERVIPGKNPPPVLAPTLEAFPVVAPATGDRTCFSLC